MCMQYWTIKINAKSLITKQKQKDRYEKQRDLVKKHHEKAQMQNELKVKEKACANIVR